MSIEFQIIHPYDHEKKIFGEMVRSSIKKPVNPYDGTHQFEYEYKRKIWDERVASLPRFMHELVGKKAGDIVHEGKDFKFNAMVCGVTCSPNGVYCNNYCNADKTKKMPDRPMLYAVPIINEPWRDWTPRYNAWHLFSIDMVKKAFYLSVCDLPEEEQEKYWDEFKNENNIG